jgi:hypothetical protein
LSIAITSGAPYGIIVRIARGLLQIDVIRIAMRMTVWADASGSRQQSRTCSDRFPPVPIRQLPLPTGTLAALPMSKCDSS